MLSVKLGGINYNFLSLWYDSISDWICVLIWNLSISNVLRSSHHISLEYIKSFLESSIERLKFSEDSTSEKARLLKTAKRLRRKITDLNKIHISKLKRISGSLSKFFEHSTWRDRNRSLEFGLKYVTGLNNLNIVNLINLYYFYSHNVLNRYLRSPC